MMFYRILHYRYICYMDYEKYLSIFKYWQFTEFYTNQHRYHPQDIQKLYATSECKNPNGILRQGES
jgi:hypothetical protein